MQSLIQKPDRHVRQGQGKFNEYDFLNSLFNHLTKSHVTYCILRNYHSLPYSTDGSDIDIFVHPTQIYLFISILNSESEKYNGRLITYYASSGFFMFCYCKPDYFDGWGIHFDLYATISFKGVPFYNNAELIKNIIYHNKIPVLNNDDAIIISFLKECLHNSADRKEYMKKSKEIYQKKNHYYYNIILYYFGVHSAKKFEALLTDSNTTNIKKFSKKAKQDLFKFALLKNPLKFILSISSYNINRFRRVLKPIGYTVAFLGTDGSGKTTIIRGVTPLLESAIHRKINYEHMRPNLLPNISHLFGKNNHTVDVNTNPHNSLPSGYLGSLARITYYSFDYILGHWLKVYPKMVKTPCIFIYDRYFYDFLIDPLRSRIRLPIGIIKLFSLLIPSPDLIICLGTNPEDIIERKQELPLREIIRQTNMLKGFCNSTDKAVWIDTGDDIAYSINEALNVITQHMAQRFQITL